jgi:protease I
MGSENGTLKGKKVAILATDGVERRELQEPRDALQAAGASTELLSLQTGSIDLRDHDLQPAGDSRVERAVAEAKPDEFDALLIPGGTVNADKLRSDEDAVRFVHDFVESGKPVGVICHAPWTLIEAGVASGRTLTSYPSLRTDLRNAGATVVDREVVIDGNLISSRSPDDLPAFCKAVVDAVAGS